MRQEAEPTRTENLCGWKTTQNLQDGAEGMAGSYHRAGEGQEDVGDIDGLKIFLLLLCFYAETVVLKKNSIF